MKQLQNIITPAVLQQAITNQLEKQPKIIEKSVYSYEEYKAIVFNLLKNNLYSQNENRKPVFDAGTIHLYKMLSLYFTNNKEFENFGFEADEVKIPYSLNKGLLLMGMYGCGKSFAMEKVFRQFTNKFFPAKMYRTMRCSNLITDFQNKGLESLIKYENIAIKDDKYMDLYIDEIGARPHIVKYYGTDYKPVEHFIDARYNIFINYKKRTHASTNLSLDEFSQLYDRRIYSRLFEMFNFIYIDSKIDFRINFVKS